MALLENKKTLVQKPRLKNFLICCGPMETNGSHQVGLSLINGKHHLIIKIKACHHTKKDTFQRHEADLYVKEAMQI
jgi:hypothetical protein